MQSGLEWTKSDRMQTVIIFPLSRKKKQFFTSSRRMSRPGNERTMKTNADDKDLQVQNRNEPPIHDLKLRPGRMKKLLPIQIEKIKKCLTDLQHEEFGSPKYLKALDHMWEGHFLLVADNRADFCKHLGLSTVVVEQLVGKLRQPEADMPDAEKNEPINTGDYPKKSPAETSSKDTPESRPPNTPSATEGAAAVSILPKPKTPPESDRDHDEPSGSASAVPVTDNTNPPKKRPTKKSQQNASDVSAMGNAEPNGPLASVEAERFLQCEEIIRVNMKSLLPLGRRCRKSGTNDCTANPSNRSRNIAAVNGIFPVRGLHTRFERRACSKIWQPWLTTRASRNLSTNARFVRSRVSNQISKALRGNVRANSLVSLE